MAKMWQNFVKMKKKRILKVFYKNKTIQKSAFYYS